jgi:hypothetical protein
MDSAIAKYLITGLQKQKEASGSQTYFIHVRTTPYSNHFCIITNHSIDFWT